MYRPHRKATIVILLIHIIDKYKENLAGIKIKLNKFVIQITILLF
jgi:hypothetical protein